MKLLPRCFLRDGTTMPSLLKLGRTLACSVLNWLNTLLWPGSPTTGYTSANDANGLLFKSLWFFNLSTLWLATIFYSCWFFFPNHQHTGWTKACDFCLGILENAVISIHGTRMSNPLQSIEFIIDLTCDIWILLNPHKLYICIAFCSAKPIPLRFLCHGVWECFGSEARARKTAVDIWGTDERRQSVALQHVSHITCKSCLPEWQMQNIAEYCRSAAGHSPHETSFSILLFHQWYSMIFYVFVSRSLSPASVIKTKKGRGGAESFDASEATFASARRTERAITRTASAYTMRARLNVALNVERSQDLETSRRAYPGWSKTQSICSVGL